MGSLKKPATEPIMGLSMRTHITIKLFLRRRCGPTSRGRTCLSFTNSSIFGMRFHGLRRSLPFPPKKNGKSPKEENAAPSLRPENFAGHYPTRNSLPAVAQTSAPADATGEIFSLRAPASVQRGGDAAPVFIRYHAWGAGFIFDADVSHTPMRAHIEKSSFFIMPGEVLCRRFAAPLC